MKLNEALKLRLEQLLKERGISLYAFTKDNGIPRSTITNLANGHTKSPTLATIYQIADALGITVVEFLNCELLKDRNVQVE